jgi:phosphoribosylaminoimidazole carboxylase (NCAIR synthetase)
MVGQHVVSFQSFLLKLLFSTLVRPQLEFSSEFMVSFRSEISTYVGRGTTQRYKVYPKARRTRAHLSRVLVICDKSRKKTTKRASWLLEKLQFLSPFIATRAPIQIWNL